MRKKYPNPPLLETYCEFIFLDKSWDWTIPGLLYQDIKNEFPIKEEVKSFGFKVNPRKPKLEDFESPTIDRMRFSTKNKHELVQVGENLLAINCLPPYIGWENFSKRILDVLMKYLDISKSKMLNKITLRYINKIIVQDESLELSNFLNIVPQIPPEIPQKFDGVNLLLNIPYSDDKSKGLNLRIVTNDKLEQNSILLDFSFVIVLGMEPEINQIGDILDDAHNNISTIFESSITDKTRTLFKER